MKNLTYKEAVKAWENYLSDNATALRQNTSEGCVKAFLGESFVYTIERNTTQNVEEDGTNLVELAAEIEDNKKRLIMNNPGIGYISVEQVDAVDYDVYDNDVTVNSVTIRFSVTGLVPKDYKELVNLNMTKSLANHSFQSWLYKHTAKEPVPYYVGYYPIKCEILKLYRDGILDLVTLQEAIHGGCDV